MTQRPGSAPEPRAGWYGWQIIISDVGTLLLAGVAGRNDRSDIALITILLGYTVVPPVIHGLHDNGGHALMSVGMRLGLPFAGALVGGASSSGCRGADDGVDEWNINLCQLEWAAAGLLIGMASASVLDVIFASEPRSSQQSATRLVPHVLVSDHQAQLGIAGSF